MKAQFKSAYSYGLLMLHCVLLSSCALHSVEENPRILVEPAQSFSINTPQGGLHKPWWESFNRPDLNGLIDQALNRNFDLLEQIAVLAQADALVLKSRSQQWPQLDIVLDGSKRWQSGDAQRGTASAGGALSWEIDFWQGIKNAAKADRFDAQARAADLTALKLAISAEVSHAYFGAVAANAQINLLKQQLSLDKDLEDILSLRLKSGVGNNVDVLQQQARVADSATLIPLAESELAVYENRLDVLLGQAPDGRLRVSQTESLNFTADLPPVGVPVDLLLNRPDLLSARASLIAADADIAVAIAERLPSLTLDGSLTYEDTTAFTGPVSLLSAGFVQPLLDWGQRKAEVMRNKALYQQRLAAYTQQYLEAVEAVENALVKDIKQRDFLNRLDTQRDILQRAANAAEQRYKQGVDDYQAVIDALQELRSVERRLVTEKLALLAIRIDLFRAIGGPVQAYQPLPDTNSKG